MSGVVAENLFALLGDEGEADVATLAAKAPVKAPAAKKEEAPKQGERGAHREGWLPPACGMAARSDPASWLWAAAGGLSLARRRGRPFILGGLGGAGRGPRNAGCRAAGFHHGSRAGRGLCPGGQHCMVLSVALPGTTASQPWATAWPPSSQPGGGSLLL